LLHRSLVTNSSANLLETIPRNHRAASVVLRLLRTGIKDFPPFDPKPLSENFAFSQRDA